MEGVALNRPPIFNGDDYVQLKMRMKTFIMSHDFRAWMVITNWPIIPMKEENGTKLPKKFEEYTNDDYKIV